MLTVTRTAAGFELDFEGERHPVSADAIAQFLPKPLHDRFAQLLAAHAAELRKQATKAETDADLAVIELARVPGVVAGQRALADQLEAVAADVVATVEVR